jgi:hypothetical protein
MGSFAKFFSLGEGHKHNGLPCSSNRLSNSLAGGGPLSAILIFR